VLKIPKRLEAAFKEFLDIAQFHFPESTEYTDEEQEVLNIIRSYLGKNISTRR
jgi:hypothetical protein